MDDFTSKPGAPNLYGALQSEANAIQPGKKPLSSMTPTIVLKDGRFYFALGSPGGTTIINTVLQVISNVIDYGMNLQTAVSAPRVHHQWIKDLIYVEPDGINADTRATLEKMGHAFAVETELLGDAEAVMRDEKGVLLGASDPRRGGASAGY
jgi:gamma-glutamyltranspeptidase/glutathione hydrolase